MIENKVLLDIIKENFDLAHKITKYNSIIIINYVRKRWEQTITKIFQCFREPGPIDWQEVGR